MSLIKEIDYGTPIRQSDKLVNLTIDGQSISVPAGTSVMAAAMRLGTQIPKLCATDSLEPFGSCRLCLVEIEGRRGTPASCTTPAEAGMVVHTQNPRLAKLRKGVMELYISDHPLDCLTCSANGDCELQDMAGAVGLREVRYDATGANHFSAQQAGAPNALYLETDVSNPYFAYDPAKCIVCNRCVRACEEVQGTFALTISGRGFDSRVSAGGLDFLASDRHAGGEIRHRARPARAFQGDDLRLLRGGLLVQGGDAGRQADPHGPLQGWPRERGPFLREGPVRLWLRHAQGSHHQADDPCEDHRPVAGSKLGRRDQPRRQRVPPHSGHARPGVDRGDLLVALHQ
jgi:ferredoxin